MHRTIYLTTVLLFIGTLFSACEKSDIDPAKLGDPVKIELRGAEAEIVKTDQQFAFDFFNHVFNEEKGESFMVSPLSLRRDTIPRHALKRRESLWNEIALTL